MMPGKPAGPLRQRTIDDMAARRFGEDTQRDSVRAVKNFTFFLGRSQEGVGRLVLWTDPDWSHLFFSRLPHLSGRICGEASFASGVSVM